MHNWSSTIFLDVKKRGFLTDNATLRANRAMLIFNSNKLTFKVPQTKMRLFRVDFYT